MTVRFSVIQESENNEYNTDNVRFFKTGTIGNNYNILSLEMG